MLRHPAAMRVLALVQSFLILFSIFPAVALAEEGDSHVHTGAEPVWENLVEATEETDGSHDLVVYCTECGEELSRETIIDSWQDTEQDEDGVQEESAEDEEQEEPAENEAEEDLTEEKTDADTEDGDSADVEPANDVLADDNPADDDLADDDPTGDTPADDDPTDNDPTDNDPTDNDPTDDP